MEELHAGHNEICKGQNHWQGAKPKTRTSSQEKKIAPPAKWRNQFWAGVKNGASSQVATVGIKSISHNPG